MKKKKALKITLIVLCTIVLVVVFLLAGVKVGERLFFTPFFMNAETEFKIPGLSDGYIPQGFDKIEIANENGEKKTYFLACGYMNDKSASCVYFMDEDGKVIKKTRLQKKNGDDYLGHAGGLSHFGSYLYIAGSNGFDVFNLKDFTDSDASHSKMLDSVALIPGISKDLAIDPAYCYVREEGGVSYLYAGSFHKDSDYNTGANQHITTPANDENKSVLIKFRLDEAKTDTYGINQEIVSLYSTPSFVQGICFTDDGKLVLSTSWGLSISKLYVHDLAKVEASKGTANSEYWGNDVALYYVDSNSLVDTIDAPPMAEEIIYHNGRIWIMNESACNKYIFGKFTSGNYLYSYEY